ncbi:MAG: hypothetical protein WC476_11695 [Phycisphaerae bacterium]
MNQRAEQIKDAARKIAGCDITIRVGEVEPMLIAGWDAIPVGSVVWADCLRLDGAKKLYRKTSATEITAEIGGRPVKTAAVSANQIDSMVDSFITRSIVGAKK